MPKKYLKGIKIIYEDRDLIVIDKPPGLLTMASDKEKEKTAYYILTDYVRKGYSKSPNRIFIVHRLDRDTSGIIVFAKNERAKIFLQNNWKNTEKRYLAVVHGILEKKEDTITCYLAENKAKVVYSTSDRSIGRLSTTIYKVLKEKNGKTLLELDLVTGRKNQIRVHLADIGHPVIGDKKYGLCVDDRFKYLALHAYSISFDHPFNKRRLTLKAEPPKYLMSELDYGRPKKG